MIARFAQVSCVFLNYDGNCMHFPRNFYHITSRIDKMPVIFDWITLWTSTVCIRPSVQRNIGFQLQSFLCVKMKNFTSDASLFFHSFNVPIHDLRSTYLILFLNSAPIRIYHVYFRVWFSFTRLNWNDWVEGVYSELGHVKYRVSMDVW